MLEDHYYPYSVQIVVLSIIILWQFRISEFDMCITQGKNLLFRESTDASEEIKVMFVDEIFRIETRSSSDHEENGGDEQIVARMKKPDCDWCKDNPRRKCKHCACSVCGGKDDPAKQLLCDECDMAYHLWCLNPPLSTIPDVDEWYDLL